MDISPQVRDKLAQFQNLQSQLQLMVAQKQQLILQDQEIKNAMEELEKVKAGKIYRSVGNILVEISKEEGMKKLEEDKSTISTRIQILERQEKKLSEKLQSLGAELQGLLGSKTSPPGAGG